MVSNPISDAELYRVAQELPAAPRLLVELGQLIRNPRVDGREVTSLLRQDPALVARIISMANSAAYARAEPAASIEEAVASVGFREVHRLVGAVAATQMADQRLDRYGIDGAQLRHNSLFIAVVMEELGEAAGEEPRSCYTVGMLRSIGKMALERLGPDQGATPTFPASGQTELDRWEETIWGVSNCVVAERILLHWRMPQDAVVSIRHHYRPERRHNPIIHLLNLAAGSAEHRCFGLPGEEGFWQFTPENFARAGLDARQFQALTERAQRTYQRLHAAAA